MTSIETGSFFSKDELEDITKDSQNELSRKVEQADFLSLASTVPLDAEKQKSQFEKDTRKQTNPRTVAFLNQYEQWKKENPDRETSDPFRRPR